MQAKKVTFGIRNNSQITYASAKDNFQNRKQANELKNHAWEKEKQNLANKHKEEDYDKKVSVPIVGQHVKIHENRTPH